MQIGIDVWVATMKWKLFSTTVVAWHGCAGISRALKLPRLNKSFGKLSPSYGDGRGDKI